MLSLILATAIGGCPLPLPLPTHHKHHKSHHKTVLPLCSCVAEPLPIPLSKDLSPLEPEMEPIELNILRYYVPLISSDGLAPETWDWADLPVEPRWIESPRYTISAPAMHAPEIDPSSGIAAITMLALGLLVICDRRPRI